MLSVTLQLDKYTYRQKQTRYTIYSGAWNPIPQINCNFFQVLLKNKMNMNKTS